MARWILAAGLAVSLAASGSVRAQAEDRDAYLAGYVHALLDRDFTLKAPSLWVGDGIVTISEQDLAGADRRAVTEAVERVPGIRKVVVSNRPAPSVPEETGVLLPHSRLFAPLIADPRWPHFSASYQKYREEDADVGAVSFGDTFTFYEESNGSRGAWSVGLQAGVFAIFDLGAESKDLVNADYWVGLPLAWRRGNWSALGRLYHQSSHLGDEFLLRHRVRRVNLSYEAVDAKLSYDIGGWARLYGGLGYMFDREPDNLKPWTSQAGLELRGPQGLWGLSLRPVAGFDLQATEESGWNADISARVGIELLGREGRSRTIQLMLEYFHGRNPNGQFYNRDIQYWGIGLHAYL